MLLLLHASDASDVESKCCRLIAALGFAQNMLMEHSKVCEDNARTIDDILDLTGPRRRHSDTDAHGRGEKDVSSAASSAASGHYSPTSEAAILARKAAMRNRLACIPLLHVERANKTRAELVQL